MAMSHVRYVYGRVAQGRPYSAHAKRPQKMISYEKIDKTQYAVPVAGGVVGLERARFFYSAFTVV